MIVSMIGMSLCGRKENRFGMFRSDGFVLICLIKTVRRRMKIILIK